MMIFFFAAMRDHKRFKDMYKERELLIDWEF